MDIQQFPIELATAKAKTLRNLSYAAIALSALYIIESYLTFVILIPFMIIPFLGYIPLIFLSSIEFLLFISATITSVYAIILSSKLTKEISPISSYIEGIAIQSGINKSRIFTLIAIALTALNFIMMLGLNIIKFIFPLA